MTSYISLIRKDADSDFGVDFRDFPGCVSAGVTLAGAHGQYSWAKTQLSRLVDAAAASEEMIIANSGKPLARLGPLVGPQRKRCLGVLAGKLRVPEDFDAPLPDAVNEAFEGC